MKAILLLGVTGLALTAPELHAQTTLPPVVVTGTRIGGGTIICRGTACEGVLRALAGPDHYIESELPLQPDQVSIPLDPAQVCANLEQAQPPNCSLNNPPSMPGYDPNWIANGCGDGTVASEVGEFLAGLVLPDHTGNLNNPLPGISFYGACAAHDKCYGSGGGLYSKGMCDGIFNYNMDAACDAGSPTYAPQCADIREAYVDAVETSFGQSAYDAAQSNLACAAWASDMEENECDE